MNLQQFIMRARTNGVWVSNRLNVFFRNNRFQTAWINNGEIEIEDITPQQVLCLFHAYGG